MVTKLRTLDPQELTGFCETLKKEVISRVSDKIPHLESSLAVAELTVALHYVLRTPVDVLIWDVGHQGYIHKALTGRLDQLKNQRTTGGISGFLKRDESPYDFFGAGHASTSISALAGVCIADGASGLARHRVAVIGDGSLTGGQSFEALNHLSTIDTNALVVLNDNDGSIDPTIGGLHASGDYQRYFESLGWTYSTCGDGHDLSVLVPALQERLAAGGKQVLHVRTKRPDLSPPKSYKPGTTFQWWAAQEMETLLTAYPKLQVISPAMFAGSGFAPLRVQFSERLHDTGITEPHAVTLAAGMAAAGALPWVHIYSTFLQRAIDQVIHDVALQRLPVVFLVDRAGLVGSDGATHHGVFDAGMLHDVPGATIWQPKDGDELQAMMREAAKLQSALTGPLFIRYPKSKTTCEKRVEFSPFTPATSLGSNALLVSTGALSAHVDQDLFDHIHLAQTKPLPADFCELLTRYDSLVLLEEANGFGGMSGSVTSYVSKEDVDLQIVVRKIPDAFTDHGVRNELLKGYGLIS
jgi:1-deoxy-D-xylulose-5-phosphate synthase